MVSALRNTSGMITALPRLSTTPPSCERGERRGESPEVAMARVADRGAAGGRMLVDDLGADRRVHGARDAERARAEQQRELGVRERRFLP